MTTSAFATASSGSSAILSESTARPDRVQPVTSQPVLTRRAAMAAPIRPRPRTAIARDEVIGPASTRARECDKRTLCTPAMRNTHTVSMSLTAWRTFVTVCRLGSLSAAAAELGYTQSAVSRQIAGLEREIGAPLVERHARGIRPTAAGEAFRHHAQAAVNESERALRPARDARDGSPARPLRGGATPSLAAGVGP